MRLRDVPRGLPSEDQVAEPLEVGAGMRDPHAKHGMNDAERRHFEELERRPVDPRDLPSDIHDRVRPASQSGVLIDDMRGPAATRGERVCRGVVVGCFMQSGGAHVELEDGEGVLHYLFWPGVRHVVMGTAYDVSVRHHDGGDRLLFREVSR